MKDLIEKTDVLFFNKNTKNKNKLMTNLNLSNSRAEQNEHGDNSLP